MDEIGKGVGCRRRAAATQGREAREHGLGLEKLHVADLAAVAPVPAEGRTLEAGRLRVEEDEQELERIFQADVLEVGRRRERNRRIARVESAS